jgi:hypothetical protein
MTTTIWIEIIFIIGLILYLYPFVLQLEHECRIPKGRLNNDLMESLKGCFIVIQLLFITNFMFSTIFYSALHRDKTIIEVITRSHKNFIWMFTDD